MIRKVMVIFITTFIEPFGDSLYATAATLFAGVLFYSDEIENTGTKYFLISVIFFANGIFAVYFVKAGYAEFQLKVLEDMRLAKQKYKEVKYLKKEKAMTTAQKEAMAQVKERSEEMKDLLVQKAELETEILLTKGEIHAALRHASAKKTKLVEQQSDLADLQEKMSQTKGEFGKSIEKRASVMGNMADSVKRLYDGLKPSVQQRDCYTAESFSSGYSCSDDSNTYASQSSVADIILQFYNISKGNPPDITTLPNGVSKSWRLLDSSHEDEENVTKVMRRGTSDSLGGLELNPWKKPLDESSTPGETSPIHSDDEIVIK